MLERNCGQFILISIWEDNQGVINHEKWQLSLALMNWQNMAVRQRMMAHVEMVNMEPTASQKMPRG